MYVWKLWPQRPPVWGSSVLTVVQGVDRAGADRNWARNWAKTYTGNFLMGSFPQEDHGQRDEGQHRVSTGHKTTRQQDNL